MIGKSGWGRKNSAAVLKADYLSLASGKLIVVYFHYLFFLTLGP